MSDSYPPDWDRRRKLVYRRDNYQCQKCGRYGGPHGNAELHCHHIRPKSKGGSHHPSNLQTLCWRCHNRVHRHHIPRKSSRRSRSKSTSATGSGDSYQNTNSSSTDVEIGTQPDYGKAIFKGFLAFLAFATISRWLLGGLLPEQGPIGDLYVIIGFLIWFAVAHANVGENNTLYITGLAGYSIFVIWLSFTFFRGILTFLASVYLFGIFAVAIIIITEREWVSQKPEDTEDDRRLDVLMKLGYVILGLSSWPVAWWFTDHLLEALHIVDVVEQTLTSTPTPVSWLIADRIQSIAATFALSTTLFGIFTFRRIANAAFTSRIERWTITSIQFFLTVYVGWQLTKLTSIARTTMQLLLPLLMFTVCVSTTLWPPVRSYFIGTRTS